LNRHAKYAGQRLFRITVIVRAHRHTYTPDRCSTWTTEVVDETRLGWVPKTLPCETLGAR